MAAEGSRRKGQRQALEGGSRPPARRVISQGRWGADSGGEDHHSSGTRPVHARLGPIAQRPTSRPRLTRRAGA